VINFLDNRRAVGCCLPRFW